MSRDRTEEYRRGQEQGRAEAEEALAAGSPSLYVYGRRDVSHGLDRGTGLPLVAIAGCMIDEATEGRAAGYNQCVRKHIAANGRPPSSRKRFEADLFDLAGYAARCADELRRFKIGGPEVASLDGRLAVRVFRSVENRRQPIVNIAVDKRSVESFLPLGFGGRRLAFAPGPAGSDTLIIRGEMRKRFVFVLFGLRGEQGWLRIELR